MKPKNTQPVAPPRVLTCGSLRKGSRRIAGLLACITGLLACHASAATTITYDFESLNSNASGTINLNGQDSWSASTDIKVLDGKFAGSWSFANVANGNRPNNVGFTMTVPAAVTEFSLSTDIRYGTFVDSGTQIRRSMFGLTVGSGSFLFGAGGDDTQDNKWLIQSGSNQNFSTAVTTTASSLFGTVRLDVNLSANSGNGSGSLFLDNVAISDLQNINLNLTALTGYSNGSSFDGMAISVGDFGRVDNLTLSYIPEPSAALLGGLGLLVLLRRRR